MISHVGVSVCRVRVSHAEWHSECASYRVEVELSSDALGCYTTLAGVSSLTSGVFAFAPIPAYCGHEFRLGGEVLPKSEVAGSTFVYFEPRHLLLCLGAEVADRFAMNGLRHRESLPGDFVSMLFSLLGVVRAVSLVVEYPPLERYLSAEAAAAYADGHSMLGDAWEML